MRKLVAGFGRHPDSLSDLVADALRWQYGAAHARRRTPPGRPATAAERGSANREPDDDTGLSPVVRRYVRS